MKTEKKVQDLTLAGIFTAIIIIMAVVPFLGYIPLGFMNATIIHVPVIIGAIIMGPRYGAYLGLVFGITSLIKNTMMPNPTSFVFSPFVTIGEYSGNFKSILICIVPRILIGVVAYAVYRLFMKLLREKKSGRTVSLWAAGIAGSLTNTVLVMNGIYFFFGKSYAAATNKVLQGLYYVILGAIGTQGVPEAILAGILTSVIVPVLLKVKNR